jgi:hypothetical protein
MRLTRRPFPTLLMLAALAAGAVAVPARPAAAAIEPAAAKALYERVSPSLVAVQFVWETELGRRELTGAGVVISEDGLVVTSIGVVDPRIPDAGRVPRPRRAEQPRVRPRQARQRGQR